MSITYISHTYMHMTTQGVVSLNVLSCLPSAYYYCIGIALSLFLILLIAY